MSMLRQLRLWLGLALAVVLVGPQTCLAGSDVGFSGAPSEDYRLSVVGTSGPDEITIKGSGTETSPLSVTDPDGVSTADASCRRVSATEVHCVVHPRFEVLAELGGGADRAYLLVAGNAYRSTVNAGRGQDFVYGSPRRDLILGGPGRDEIIGDSGADEIRGGAGRDDLDGGDDRDELRGGRGADELAGGDDADTMVGGRGRDRLAGGDGADLITGGRARDVLLGEAGADEIHAEDRRIDTALRCGPDVDYIYVDPGERRHPGCETWAVVRYSR